MNESTPSFKRYKHIYLFIGFNLLSCNILASDNKSNVHVDLAYEMLCESKVIKEEEKAFKDNYKTNKALIENRYLCYGMETNPTWKIKKAKDNKYNVRVVIIGESTNKDYMSVFGYPEETTPFLNKANGTFFKNFISTSANTVQTLTRTLLALDKNQAKEAHKPTWDSPNSVVTLANAAGYETYFISNQDISGPYDAANTNIALRSNYYVNEAQKTLSDGTKFERFVPNVNKQMHNGKPRNDLNLLYRFKDALDDKSSSKDKMIFLHLWGPHGDYGNTPEEQWSNCGLMKNYDVALPKFDIGFGPKVNCYLQGVYTSDKVIESVFNELKNRDLNFSIVYMSDHGHDVDYDPAHEDDSKYKSIHHNAHTKGGYRVPLVVINSDDNTRKFKNEYLSQFNFIDLYASWLGLETNLTNKNFSFEKYPVEKIRTWNWSWDGRDYESLGELPILKRRATN